MSSPQAAPRRSRAISDQPVTDNLNFQYPLSDSDSSLIEHLSTTIMDSDTNSEDGLGYLSDSTYEIISQSSFQASDSENEYDDGPGIATPQDTDVESVEEFDAATPSETSGCEEHDAIPTPPAQSELSFEEWRLGALARHAERYSYTPEERGIDEQLSTPSLNTSTIRGSAITSTSASNSIEDWINFKEPITSVADGLVNVTNEKQDVATSTVENTTSHVIDQVEEAANNAVEACINLIDTVSRYVRTHLVESAYQRLPSRDALVALLPEDPRASMPSLWAIAAFLVTPFLINCIVTLAQSVPSASKAEVCLSDRTCIPEHLVAEAKRNVSARLQARLDLVESVASFSKASMASVASIASKSKAFARSETGLSVFEPTTKPHAGWFGKAKTKAKAKPDLQSPWKINSGNQTGRFVLQHNKPLVDQFQVNISSSQHSRSILFNPRDDTMHYPESEESTMQSKIFRFNQTTVELELPPSWPCGRFNVSVMPYLKEPPYTVTTIFLTEKPCEPAPSWKDFDATVTRVWEEFQAHLSRQAKKLRPFESTADALLKTVDGRCGVAHGSSVCGSWSGGSCCSKFGWCGNSSGHCGAGCQSGCKNSLIALPALPKLPKLPHFDTRKLPTPREITQFLKDDLRQTQQELRDRAELFWEKLKEMNARMTEYSAKSREERQLRREMKKAKALHRKLHRASEPGLPSLPVKKARMRALKLRDRADGALKKLQLRFQRWEARIGR